MMTKNVRSSYITLFYRITGDEIALDDDASYLDDVVKAPAAPDKEPGADSVRNKDGVPVDEFGLPQVPSAAQTSRWSVTSHAVQVKALNILQFCF